MKTVLVLLCLCDYFVNNEARYTKNITYGSIDRPLRRREAELLNEQHSLNRSTSTVDIGITPTVNYFSDTNQKPIVYWLGKDNDVIIYLARNQTFSSVSISYDNGESFVDKTDQFKIENGSHAILEKLYYHPTNNSHIVFTDVINNKLYLTASYGRDIRRIDLNFTPNDVLFHKLQPAVFVVLNKKDELWITEDFGQSFRLVDTSIEGFSWVQGNDLNYSLVLQRRNSNGSSDILFLNDFYSNASVTVYETDVKDFFMRDDYLFMTKLTDDDDLELQTSYKLGKKIKCDFFGTLSQKGYFVVDVTNNRIVIVVSHSSTVSHLYVSEIFHSDKDVLKFSLSLEDVLSYFPNNTWHDSWLSYKAPRASADVYKIKDSSGIFIATKVLTKPQGNLLGLDNLGSVITYDHGVTWRPIRPPHNDSSCLVQNNCSLHLGQKYSQLQMESKFVRIVSSKSAPGIILASGVLGRSLDAPYYKVYISTDSGLSWKETLPNSNFYNMGDHGGILVAARSDTKTGHISYSIDGGETWKNIELPEENLRIHDLMTSKAEKSTVFNIVGFSIEKKQWVFIKLDLIKAFERKCLKDDYELWPNRDDTNRRYISCVLGAQKTYQRRKSDVNCYNGLNFDPFISTMSCGCDYYDFECDFGFARLKINGHCIHTKELEDTFKVPSTCRTSESYNLTKGYRKIQGDVCRGGFENHYQPKEIPCPLEYNQSFILVAAKKRIHKFDLLTQTGEDLQVKNVENVVAVEYDMKRNCVYWADLTLHQLGRQCSNNIEPETLLSTDLGGVEGMSLDWVSNNLYFVNAGHHKIELIRIDTDETERTRRTVLGPNVLEKPRGIAVHPEAGYLFWTDWSYKNPSISRSNLDGTNVRRLFTSPIVKWPNGVTIDFIAERIYWTDGRLDYIASSDLQGDFFQKIASDVDSIHHPYGIAVFRNNIYWDDWSDRAVFTSDKDSFHQIKAIQKNFSVLFDLKVYGHGMQVGTNACERNNCSDICVGTLEKDKYVCLSPDERNYTTSVRNISSEHDNNACKDYEFMCENGRCTPLKWKCDGDDDCGDNSDEVDCRPKSCENIYFTCGDGRCVPMIWRCDGEFDCNDNSDEVGCNNKTCPGGTNCSLANGNCTHEQFACTNGNCIPTKLKCDGKNDCIDGSDEKTCGTIKPSTTKLPNSTVSEGVSNTTEDVHEEDE